MAFSPPAGWPCVSSSLMYDEPRKAIDFLCKAFGFKVELLVEGENNSVVHSQLVSDGGGFIMVGGDGSASGNCREWKKSPHAIGGANTQSLMMFVPDVDAHLARAKEAGAKILGEPKISDYGDDYWSDKSYEAEDLEGHHWYFVQRLRDPKKA